MLDSTILVSAFLTLDGAADAVLHLGIDGQFTCCLAEEIIEETARRLRSPRLQERYAYTAADVDAFKTTLWASFVIVDDLPPLTGIVRDPNDDMILACAVVGTADYVVTRDDDLLSLDTYAGIAMVTREAFLALLRSTE